MSFLQSRLNALTKQSFASWLWKGKEVQFLVCLFNFVASKLRLFRVYSVCSVSVSRHYYFSPLFFLLFNTNPSRFIDDIDIKSIEQTLPRKTNCLHWTLFIYKLKTTMSCLGTGLGLGFCFNFSFSFISLFRVQFEVVLT